MKKTSEAYKNLCAEFYELDKPSAPPDAIQYYLDRAAETKGKILEPMCGTGRFLIPLLENGYDVTGFDNSSHMLETCKNKCAEKQLKVSLFEASFENFHSKDLFQLVFIPSSSFCLLTDPVQAQMALKVIMEHLSIGGKFILEIETVKAVNELQGIWRSRWIDKPDGTILVGSFASRLEQQSRIETALCRYELWQNNSVVRMEVENFPIRLYEVNEIEGLLEQQGFTIEKKCIPYAGRPADNNAPVILYECGKIK